MHIKSITIRGFKSYKDEGKCLLDQQARKKGTDKKKKP
jgi:chromosome segregation ATPase